MSTLAGKKHIKKTYSVEEFGRWMVYFSSHLFVDFGFSYAWFYRYDASHLAVLKVKDKQVVEMIAPEWVTDFNNITKEFDALLTTAPKDDGHYLVDYRRGHVLGKYETSYGLDINWDHFVSVPDMFTQKTFIALCHIDQIICTAVYTSTVVPSLLALMNRLDEFLEPVKEHTALGIYIIQSILLEEMNIPKLTITEVKRFLPFLVTSGESNLQSENFQALREILHPEFERVFQEQADNSKKPEKEYEAGSKTQNSEGFSGILTVKEVAQRYENNSLAKRDGRYHIDFNGDLGAPYELISFKNNIFHIHFVNHVVPPSPEHLRKVLEIPLQCNIKVHQPRVVH